MALTGIEFELELKGFGEPFLDAVLQTVMSADVLDRVEFTTANLPLLALLKSKAPAARTGLFSQPQQVWMSDDAFEHRIVGVAVTAGADVVHVHAGSVTPRIADRLHALGLGVHANDATSVDFMRRAVQSGADRMSVNDVSLAVQAAGRVSS